MNKPHVLYPCSWSYCVIGLNKKAVEQAVAECLSGLTYDISHSKNSKKGTYVSYNVETVVLDESMRNDIHSALKKHEAITMVL